MINRLSMPAFIESALEKISVKELETVIAKAISDAIGKEIDSLVVAIP